MNKNKSLAHKILLISHYQNFTPDTAKVDTWYYEENLYKRHYLQMGYQFQLFIRHIWLKPRIGI